MTDKKVSFFAKKNKKELSKQSRRMKTLNLILAIGLAVALWAFVIGEVNPETDKTLTGVPLTVSGLDALEDQNLVVLTEFDDTVTAVIEGRRNDIYNVNASKLSARLDLSDCVEGENQVTISVTAPENVTKATVKDANIVVVVDKIVTAEKDVDIITDGGSDETDGIEVSSVSLDKVEIRGPSTYVAKVDSVVGILKVKQGVNSYTQNVSLIAVDKDGKAVDGVEILDSTVAVEAYATTTKEIKVNISTVGTAPEGVTVDVPDSVNIKVKGKADSISKLSSLDAEPVDISDITENTTEKLTVTLPSGVSLSEGSGASIEDSTKNTITIEIDIKVSSDNTEQEE